ncbi:hypothetical protein HYPDE_39263 [Hyphomicrobium denitrificans 1NES1]|uniref:Uncharacterized protein n=1 Tax=Hyphomicrobium denitrificans 1NES1 TaxID=670307 RepID=N0BBC2_9HYPH|nr:hypothetical protein HYPDE_39263 [Hyphomicrobium denitrificans 1NES1]
MPQRHARGSRPLRNVVMRRATIACKNSLETICSNEKSSFALTTQFQIVRSLHRDIRLCRALFAELGPRPVAVLRAPFESGNTLAFFALCFSFLFSRFDELSFTKTHRFLRHCS